MISRLTMPSQSLAFRATHYFSPLICDYLDEKKELSGFYNRFPTLVQFKGQIEEKSRHFASVNRAVLENVLLRQYADVDATLETHNNIISLRKSNAFTVTTGHQLNLFTGPLYFLYKIFPPKKLALVNHFDNYQEAREMARNMRAQ